MIFDLEKRTAKENYELLLGAVVPRPIAWVSSRSKDGTDNLAPFSFFNLFSVNPPVLGFSPGLKQQKDSEPVFKDTLRNIIDTEEFVVNIVSAELAEKMVQTSKDYAPEISEFDACGLGRQKSFSIGASRVAEAKIALECRLYKIIKLGSNNLILGKIHFVHVDDNILSAGKIDINKLKPVGRLGGELYSQVLSTIEIPRP